MTTLREALADLAHDRWSCWMGYLFSKGSFNSDCSWTMPAEFVERWRRQMFTPYERLPEPEKASDRLEADRVLALIGE